MSSEDSECMNCTRDVKNAHVTLADGRPFSRAYLMGKWTGITRVPICIFHIAPTSYIHEPHTFSFEDFCFVPLPISTIRVYSWNIYF